VKLRFTPSGRVQFLQAVSSILQDNHQAALQFRKKADRALRRLAKYSESGRRIPEFPDLPFRELVVPAYRFFYRRDDKIIWIIACWHGAQLSAAPDSHQRTESI